MKKLIITLFLTLCSSAYAGQNDKAVFKSSDWTVYQSKDAMTDKASCTAIYKDSWIIQGTADKFFISLRGRGGVKAYTVRVDDFPPDSMIIATRMERDVGAAILESQFYRIYYAKQLRVRILTILDTSITEDIDLTGFKDSVDYIKENKC
jgi:hypothetical protein